MRGSIIPTLACPPRSLYIDTHATRHYKLVSSLDMFSLFAQWLFIRDEVGGVVVEMRGARGSWVLQSFFVLVYMHVLSCALLWWETASYCRFREFDDVQIHKRICSTTV